ncbi:MAG: restriction endonuclease [Deltaproteobacteria bacterium]|nr:restriction endonuclease [Deltaproteobacteria bacterium]
MAAQKRQAKQSRLELPGGAGRRMGRLFPDYFLEKGIRAMPEWQEAEEGEGFRTFAARAHEIFEAFPRGANPDEAFTEQELIRPVLEALGWDHYLPQQGTQRRRDVPDLLLFADAEAKRLAKQERSAPRRFAHGLAIAESKRWGLPLDARAQDDRGQAVLPAGQVLRYLLSAEIESEGRIHWALLTNGAVWRLYGQRARPRALGYFEVDLTAALGMSDPQLFPALGIQQPDMELRLFWLLFRRASLAPRDGEPQSFLETARLNGQRYQERVAADLSGVVFKQVFPNLVAALANATSKALLPEVRDAALIFLYRLLFVLYAEDRNLLPVHDHRYERYGARKNVRDDIAERLDRGSEFGRAPGYWLHLRELFHLVDEGDSSIGLPPYNGGLFARDAAPLLEEAQVPDAELAPILDELFRMEAPGAKDDERLFVNYRDLSVQQLGSIYERLLEHEPVRESNGAVSLHPEPYVRKNTGSYYTPQELVDLIVEQTLSPAIEENSAAFQNRAVEFRRKKFPIPKRRAKLRELDPAAALLKMRVLDPAMGSGHFLVTAADYMADRIAELIESAPYDAGDPGYESPLVARIAEIRGGVLAHARENKWAMAGAELGDREILRRMVMKRCLYGVDKNPMAVELAKVALWLHSFIPGAPLSFLDHHLRCGDALFGMRVRNAAAEIRARDPLFGESAAVGLLNAANEVMNEIEEIPDSDIAEIRASSDRFDEITGILAPMNDMLNFWSGARWLAIERREKKLDALPGLAGFAGRGHWKFFRSSDSRPEELPELQQKLVLDARSVSRRERFLHWDVAFPGVWRYWEAGDPEDGFDAVIGNPPWDRIRLEQVEWFSSRKPEIAGATRAADRKRMIAALAKKSDPLADEYENEQKRSKTMAALARQSGHYPLLSKGDINLYGLFVERARSLLRPSGMAGLLMPSGIYAGKHTVSFFREIATGGHLRGLYDFENRRGRRSSYFPEVHRQFKFCALIFGGDERRFEESRCAFMVKDMSEIEDSERCFSLTPRDFALFNPNTGAAPVFRTRRGMEITRKLCENAVPLVDRSTPTAPVKAVPVRYWRMIDMTNDSYLFRPAQELKKEGFDLIAGERWKKGDEVFVPLYQGRMIQHFDHRFSGVKLNPENLQNPYISRFTTPMERTDPNFLPAPQHWISETELKLPPGDWVWRAPGQKAVAAPALPEPLGWAIGFRDITNAVDSRTITAAIVPRAAFGNTLPLLLPDLPDAREWKRLRPTEQKALRRRARAAIAQYKELAPLLLANLCSLALDYTARRKVHGTHLNWFIAEQLPVLPPAAYQRKFGPLTAAQIVRDHVLRLTYTSHNMAPFARDMAKHLPKSKHLTTPAPWDEDERRHLRARLDALYFHLYGATPAEAAEILDTFQVLRTQEQKTHTSYLTKSLILAYMNTLSAHDPTTKVSL